MKKNRISYGLNLDNIRCLLYGVGANELLSNAALFEAPIWAGCVDHPTPIDNRTAFIGAHFPAGIRDVLNRYTSFLDSKTKTEFLSEISTRSTTIRGTVKCLEEIRDIYITDNRALPETIAQNKLLLARTQPRDTVLKLLCYIDTILPIERENSKKKKADSDFVVYILNVLRDQLSKALALPDLLNAVARAFSLLLIAGLLKEKFPLCLIEFVQPIEIKSIYWARAMVSAIQINLGSLCLQLQEQDSFLEECDSWLCSQSHSIQSLKQFYSLKLKQLTTALQITDSTPVDALLERENMNGVRSYALFLHRICYYMDSFIRTGLDKLIQYIDLATRNSLSSIEEMRMLLCRYKDCLPFLRSIIYWNIVGLYSLLPSEITTELYLYAARIVPKQADSLLPLVKRTPEEVAKQCALNESRLRDSLLAVRNKSITIVFPEPFHQVGFCQYVSDTALHMEKPVRILYGQSCESCEKGIIDAFFMEFEQMDRLCHVCRQIIDLLETQTDFKQPEGSEQESNIIHEALRCFRTVSSTPSVLIQPPLSEQLYQKDMDVIEYQHFFRQTATLAASFLQHLEQVLHSDSERSREISMDFFAKELFYQIEYLRRTPNYWFAGWNAESMAYLQTKLDSLLCLSSSTDEWKATQQEADLWIQNALDEEENDLHTQERSIANETWDILKLRATLKALLSESSASE